MRQIIYFGVKVQRFGRTSGTLFTPDDTNKLFLSPNILRCGPARMAHIESKSLAYQFAAACVTVLKRRYGKDATLEIIRCEQTPKKRLVDRIRVDSKVIRKRISVGNFFSNKAPQFCNAQQGTSANLSAFVSLQQGRPRT